MPDTYITVPGGQGDIHISEDVLAVIAATAIRETEGVAAMTALTDSGAARKGAARAARIRLEDGVVYADAAIYAQYGDSIAAIGERAQKAVADAVESMTSLKSVVNIFVAGVSFDK